MNKLGILTAVALFGFGSLAYAQEEPAEETPSVEEGALAPEATESEAETTTEEAEEEAAEEVEEATEEEAALEVDMKTASEKTAGFEEIKAAPVSASKSEADEDNRPAHLKLAEGGDRAWGVSLFLDHTLGTAAFVANDELRSTNAYVGQSWAVRPVYKFELLEHKLRLTGSFGFNIELTEPNSNPARRFSPKDIGVSLSDPVLFIEPFTEIMFSASVGLSLATSYESVNSSQRWVGMRISTGAGRAFGPVYLRYGLGFTKNFNGSRLSQSYSDVGLRETSLSGLPSVRGPGTFTDPGDFGVGFNTSFAVSNSLSATYNITEELSVTYAVSLMNSFKYTASNVNVEDEFTGLYADDGRGRSDMLSPTLDITYVLDGVMEKIYPLPFTLMVAGGLTAMHPAQTENNEGIMLPFFYNVLGNRSTTNMASFYLSLAGVY